MPYTFAFTGDFQPGELRLMWSLSSMMLVLLLLPPCRSAAHGLTQNGTFVNVQA